MVKLVDTHGLGPCATRLWVRIPPSAQQKLRKRCFVHQNNKALQAGAPALGAGGAIHESSNLSQGTHFRSEPDFLFRVFPESSLSSQDFQVLQLKFGNRNRIWGFQTDSNKKHPLGFLFFFERLSRSLSTTQKSWVPGV